MVTPSSPTVSKESSQKSAFWRRLIGLAPSFFSDSLRLGVAFAQQLAIDLGPAPCAPMHLLLALSLSQRGIAAQLLCALNFHGDRATQEITAGIHVGQHQAAPKGSKIAFSRGFKIMLALASRQAKRRHDYYVGTHHVLFALAERDDLCQQFLRTRGIEASSLLSVLDELAEDHEIVD